MARFFSTVQSKEINQWRVELRSPRMDIRKNTIKSVIRAMTYGRDVSSLFQEMLYCSNTRNIEIKKLVYLFMMNYAKKNAEVTIRVINTFVRDTNDSNPIIRGLAIRSMSSLRVDKIVDHLIEPLVRAVEDEDAYVRKCAAIGIAKLFELSPELAIEKKFVDRLNDMLSDNVPMVVANAVAALSEICQNSTMIDLTFKKKTIKILLTALKECTEWGQIYILDAIADYSPEDASETDMLIEQVIPRLNHANSGVVLSAVKVLVNLLDYESETYREKTILKKMAGPLVTLLNNPPEIQFVALKNISLVVQKYPSALVQSLKMFFCKYDDPVYVKLEKVQIMVKLANVSNINTVLLELREYSQEVDVPFVRRAVRAIGRCAIKIEEAAQQCIDVLVHLIGTKVNYVVQEAVIVIKDIFRKYPNRYEKIIGILCNNLDTLDQPEAKASMIWILGEYADRIENTDDLLELFVETFFEESTQVQLQTMTACVKLFLKVPSENSKMLLKRVLEMVTDESDNPDLRDRGYMYWRLISGDLQQAKKTILSPKKILSQDSDDIPESLLESLLTNLSSLASVYHKPPEMFVPNFKKDEDEGSEEDSSEEDDDDGEEVEEVLDSSQLNDDMGRRSSQKKDEGMRQVLDGQEAGKGMSIFGKLVQKDNNIVYELVFRNETDGEMSDFACKFNKNPWSLEPKVVKISDLGTIPAGKARKVAYPVQVGSNLRITEGDPRVHNQVAIKFNGNSIVYFQDTFDFQCLFQNKGAVTTDVFQVIWETAPAKATCKFKNAPNKAQIKAILPKKNVFFITESNRTGESSIYYNVHLSYNGEMINILCQIICRQGQNTIEVNTRCGEGCLIPIFEEEIAKILGAEKDVQQANLLFGF